MKILRIVSELDFGGVEQVIALSVPVLAKSNHIEIKVIVLGRGGRISRKLIENGLSVVILNQNTKIPNLKLLHRLKKLIQNENPDVVHCQGAEANFHGLWAAKLVDVKNIIGEEIGLPNHHTYWKWIFKWVYNKADCVIAISESVAKKIIEFGEVPKEKVKVIFNPSSSKSFLIKEKNHKSDLARELRYNESFVFVTTCRLVPIKNLERLIRCFSRMVQVIPSKGLALWIIGDGPDKEQLIELAQGLNLTQKVKFYGFRDSVYEFLKAGDVFILPSLSEGSSVSLAEAMMVGLPSIVTEVGGASEILGESNSGILVDPYSEDSIFAAMKSMFELSDKERKVLGERAKRESERFSVERYVDNLMEIYRR